MFVNGVSYVSRGLDEVLSAIKALDSGFTARTRRRTDDTHYLQSEAYSLTGKGQDLLSRWQIEKDSNVLGIAKDFYDRSIIAAEKSQDNLIRAITYARYAEVAPLFSRDTGLSIRLLSDAVQLCRQCDAKDFASQFATQLHETTYEIIRNSLNHGVQSSVVDPWLAVLKKMRRQASKLFRNQHGEVIDADAHRIEQGEVGYSIDQRIGTDFLAQCISPIIQNPMTKMTALAHIDQAVDIESLDDVLRILGYDYLGAPLLVRLVGGNDSDASGNAGSKKFMASVANENVLRLLEYLKKRNVNIVSSDIMQGGQPTSVVVDPVQFSLQEAIPGKENPDFYLAQGRAILGVGERPLYEAFNLACSADRSPIKIDRRLVMALYSLSNVPIDSLYQMFITNNGMATAIIAECVESAGCLVTEFGKVSGEKMRSLSERLHELQMQGFSFDSESLERISGIVSESPIFVGSQSARMNLPLYSYLRYEFIREINDGNNLWVDAGGLNYFYK